MSIEIATGQKPQQLQSQVDVLKAKTGFEFVLQTLLERSKNPETGESFLANFLKELDGKSTVSFNHSINVAAHVYDYMTDGPGKGRFLEEDILNYTQAALCHDVGKLWTSNDTLHAGKFDEKFKENEMMAHSIQGLEDAKRLNFPKEAIFASLCHHISSNALESGPDGGFQNATASKKTWEEDFGRGYIEQRLMEECSWITKKDIEAIEIISFCDVLEAIKNNDREYKKDEVHEWMEDGGTRETESVQNAIAFHTQDKIYTYKDGETTTVNLLSKKFNDVVIQPKFQHQFDITQEAGLPSMARNLIADYAKDYDVQIYDDKIKDMEKNPETARMFMKEEHSLDGQVQFAFYDDRLKAGIVVMPKKLEPDFEKRIVPQPIHPEGKEPEQTEPIQEEDYEY